MTMAAYSRSRAREAQAAARPAAHRDVRPVADPVPPRVSAGGRYGDSARPGWVPIAVVIVLHVLGLWALVALDVIQVAHVVKPPIVVDLLPDEVPPPPPPTAEPTPPVPSPVQVVAPPPIVRMPEQPAPQVRTVEAPPPAAPVAVAAPAAVAAPGPPAEAVTPPDFAGDQLGNAAPRYPLESRRKKEQGTVVVRVQVGAGGRADGCAVRRSSGFDRLDKAAMDVVCRWKFQPATRAGQPVAWPMDVPIPFVLRS